MTTLEVGEGPRETDEQLCLGIDGALDLLHGLLGGEARLGDADLDVPHGLLPLQALLAHLAREAALEQPVDDQEADHRSGEDHPHRAFGAEDPSRVEGVLGRIRRDALDERQHREAQDRHRHHPHRVRHGQQPDGPAGHPAARRLPRRRSSGFR
ncbi:MAG: hypothetical protein IT200_18080 [Thermoleophilia bacterium]|nr:hypothetical protein [Thermoleophilia bacterium]